MFKIILKVIGIICFIILLFDVFLGIAILLAKEYIQNEIESGFTGLILISLILRTSLIAVPLGFCYLVISLLRFKDLDKIDKFFLVITLILLIGIGYLVFGLFGIKSLSKLISFPAGPKELIVTLKYIMDSISK